MDTVLQGSLQLIPAGDLLLILSQRGVTGTLELESEGRHARIVFSKERILWSQASDIHDMSESVLDVFAWRSGTFALLNAALLPDTIVLPPLHLADMLAEAERRAKVAGFFPDSAIFQIATKPEVPQAGLTSGQFRVLFALMAPLTLPSIVDELHQPRVEILKHLQVLIELGLVTVNGEIRAAQVAERADPLPQGDRTVVGSLTLDESPDMVYPLLDSEQTIGRSSDNTICIPDGSVSAQHAAILRMPTGFVIEDKQSRNGTFVNGERILGQRRLADGDLIRVGKIIMTFNIARELSSGEKSTTGWGSAGYQ